MMNEDVLRLLLADDDDDDCLLFKDALGRVPIATQLTCLEDGEHLMRLLTSSGAPIPFAIFLDLNMPRKNGYECLAELKSHQHLRHIPVIMLSTSSEKEVIDRLFREGATHYVVKPTNYTQLISLIRKVLTSLLAGAGGGQQAQFVINPSEAFRPV